MLLNIKEQTQMGNIIREFHTDRFIVRVEAEEELDLDLSWDESGEAREKLASGEWVAFCAKASVVYKGREIASDYLGECIYENISAFENHRKCAARTRELRKENPKLVCGSYFADMVTNVCEEARTFLRMPNVREL